MSNNSTGEFQNLFNFYKKLGGKGNILSSPETPFLFVHKNKVLNRRIIKEIMDVEVKEKKEGVDINLKIKKKMKLEKPIYLCFGVLPPQGVQVINMHLVVEDDAVCKIFAHCIFPFAKRVIHKMNGELFIGKNAEFTYNEVHFHGEEGAEVIPHLRGEAGENSKLNSEFSLIEGCVGILDIDYSFKVKEKGICELLTKVYGKKKDKIKIKETIYLSGAYSKGLAKSRVVLKDKAKSEVTGSIIATASYARGHVDCKEIVQDEAEASAYPLVCSKNEKATVTHEAAIGSLDRKQVQTLMAKGLSQSQAIDMIIRGILR